MSKNLIPNFFHSFLDFFDILMMNFVVQKSVSKSMFIAPLCIPKLIVFLLPISQWTVCLIPTIHTIAPFFVPAFKGVVDKILEAVIFVVIFELSGVDYLGMYLKITISGNFENSDKYYFCVQNF